MKKPPCTLMHNFIVQAHYTVQRFIRSLVASSRITHTPWHSGTFMQGEWYLRDSEMRADPARTIIDTWRMAPNIPA
jgi:hypothetical protein